MDVYSPNYNAIYYKWICLLSAKYTHNLGGTWAKKKNSIQLTEMLAEATINNDFQSPKYL